ncbi:transcriptional regulator, AraC family [Desulfarculus baarsii DSM 2075]|uniref:Transcriptional regulator, AraC family n=1 Tax=Desulfarculus baarsii (strain ATCC 33931 / DSM 2075 / LMG 7858 / VKM B-1802 / 2st14) TaxID=644282 RepID=E1QDF6_DESB2|nr:AraC family transcriptional regulator [Desulfarculus baarsii]ADK83475.1 transcriptional regulator, AraC family [Desulfarculus baarsii DSM 2075]
MLQPAIQPDAAQAWPAAVAPRWLGGRSAAPPDFRLRDPQAQTWTDLADLPGHWGLALERGLSLHTAAFSFARAGEYAFEVSDAKLNFSFCTAGQSLTDVQIGPKRLRGVSQAPSVFTASFLPQAHGVWRPMAGDCRLIGLSMARRDFARLWRECAPQAPGPGFDPFFVGAAVTPEIARAMGGVSQALAERPASALLLQCRALELMILAIRQLARRWADRPERGVPLSPRDVENLRAARQVLLDNLADPPSLAQLARRVGVNECKLKQGFRQMFGETPYGLLRQARLERAKGLLEAGEMNVCEASLAVGYANPGNFIGLFKRRFGQTPGEVRALALRAAPSPRP